MSKRSELMAAIQAALVVAFPGVEVAYWRDAKPSGRSGLLMWRDTGATHERQNREHEHTVRLEFERLVFGQNLGEDLNAALDHLIQTIGLIELPRAVIELESSGLDTLGDGQGAGIVSLVALLRYRVPAWSGA